MSGPIAVVGAAGKTGRAIAAALARHGHEVRPLVHRPRGIPGERVVDLLDGRTLAPALEDTTAVYHLAPNVSRAELEMAVSVSRACVETGVRRLVFHSVLQPGIEAMPHHWAKLHAEEHLRTSGSGLAPTILQPAPYMQNFSSARPPAPLRVPYDVHQRFSLVDLHDVAEVAVRVLTEEGYEYATFELAGPQQLSVNDVAGLLGTTAEGFGSEQWCRENAHLDGYARDALTAMFDYYDKYGLLGNSRVLETLLQRRPTSFADVLRR